MVGIHLLKWREVNTGFCTWPLSHFAGLFVLFLRSIDESTGKGRSYVKNLNMNEEFIDVVGNMV